MRILLCESSCYKPLNPYFLEALESLSLERGYDFEFIDEADFFPERSGTFSRLYRLIQLSRAGRRLQLFNEHIFSVARAFKPHLLLVVNGKCLAPTTLKAIKKSTGALAANYATDDPFNPKVTTRYFRTSIGDYDIYATPKKAVVPDLIASGCRNVVRTHFAFNPSVHYPEPPRTPEERLRFNCDVAFIGSCIPERIEWLNSVARDLSGLRLNIYGAGWSGYNKLHKYVRGVVLGRDFRLALGGARIALNFIRHANRDDHTERAFQILACGGFMLSERSIEQVRLFTEDCEASYFESGAELVQKVRHYLCHEVKRTAIATAGGRRVIIGEHTYKDRLLQILASVIEAGIPAKQSIDPSAVASLPQYDASCLVRMRRE